MKKAVFVLSVAVSLASFGCGRAQKKEEPPQTLAAPAISPEPPAAPLPKAESRRLAPGTIKVRMMGIIDSSTPIFGFTLGSVGEDVLGADSRLAIPAGTSVLVQPVRFEKNGDVSQASLIIYSVDLDGHQYHLIGEDKAPPVAIVTVNSMQDPANKVVHISTGDIVEFRLAKPAELR